MATVTCVGISVHDMVFSLGGTLNLGTKNLATTMGTVGGGPAANAAVTVAALGWTAQLVSKLGTDAIGDAMVRDLERSGVDVSRVRRVAEAPSSVSSVILDKSGDRTIVNHTDERLIDASAGVTADDLVGSDAVLVDLRWPHGASSAIEAATHLGLPSIVDFDLTTSDASAEVVRTATHVIFSRPALVNFTGMTEVSGALRAVAAKTEAFVGVTLGGDGFAWFEQDQVRTVPAFPVVVVDTLAAGDVFHGAFALGVAQNDSLDRTIRAASAAAAVKCSRPGGRNGIPNRADVDEFLETNQ